MNKSNYLFLFFLLAINSLYAQHSISGQITCLSGDPMTNQEVQLSGDQISDMTVTTDANGDYLFPNLPSGGDYTITIEKTDNPLNGVSTYDLVLISKHILQIAPFPTPFHFLIADVNSDGSVSTLDLLIMRQLILFINTSWPGGFTWHFATEDYNLNPPSGSVDVININTLNDDEVINFVGVKIGDMNQSAAGGCN